MKTRRAEIHCNHEKPQNATSAALWREWLYPRFRGQAYPVLVFPEGVVPAASLWAGARVWLDAFRAAGLGAGDRVVMALPPSPAFVSVLLAAFWEGVTLALLPPAGDLPFWMEELDACAGIGLYSDGSVWRPDVCGLPDHPAIALRKPDGPATPDARLLLQTSGSTQSPRWIALSDCNIQSVLGSHLPRLGLENARVLSALPWHHAFGLIIDLLPALLSGAEIVRDPAGGRDIESLLHLMRRSEITHFCSVPLTMQRLAARDDGQEILWKLRGGVIGGAPVNAALADVLAGTQLRVGYGQTEASPAIALGEPGHWKPHYIGRPVNCEVRLDDGQILCFRGPGACLGTWDAGRLQRLPPERWVSTGDIAQQAGADLYFAGRANDEFKLSNGRRVQAGFWENALCQSFPQINEAMLFTRDGEALELACSLVPGASLPSPVSLRLCLAELGEKLQVLHELPNAFWPRRPKGDTDRNAVPQSLQSVGERLPAAVS